MLLLLLSWGYSILQNRVLMIYTTFSGTSAHIVKVFNFQGKELSRVEPYSSFLGQNRGSPISATSFHPHRMVMGAAARGDHHINLFTCTNELVPGAGAHY